MPLIRSGIVPNIGGKTELLGKIVRPDPEPTEAMPPGSPDVDEDNDPVDIVEPD